MGDITRKFLLTHYIGKQWPVSRIASFLKCSQHKVNYWMKEHDIARRSISDAIYLKNNPDGDPFKVKKIANTKDAWLLGLGMGLYWGEGNKKNKNSIKLGNTDPVLISEFVRFLVKIFSIEPKRLDFSLQIFSDIEKDRAMDFWLFALKEFKISRSQFYKVTVTPARSLGTYRKKSRYGVLIVYFHNTKLKKILDSMLPK